MVSFLVLILFFFVSSEPNKKYWFLETFDDDLSKWYFSENEKYTARMQHLKKEGKISIPEQKQNYGMIAVLDQPFTNDGLPLIVQFEVKFRKKVDCAGSYVKLIYEDQINREKIENFSDESRYAIMFGPDKCQYGDQKDKVQFLFNYHNTKCDKWEEKDHTRPHKIFNDELTHLYTLKIRPNNTFEIYMDMHLVRKGSFFEDIEPSVVPPKFFKKNDPRFTKPKNVLNPCFFEPESPYVFEPIGGIAFDLYSGFADGTTFDNLLLTWDEEYAHNLAMHTWYRTHSIETYDRPYHYDENYELIWDGPEILEFENDFDYDEL